MFEGFRAMTKHLKHLKTFEFHSIIMCPFFLSIDALIGFCSTYSGLKNQCQS